MFTSLPHTNSHSHNHKPHKANQPAWLAMKRLQQQHGQVGLHHFQLLHLVGSGNIANVYVCKVKQQPAVELQLPHRLYAMKVVDREASSVMNKKHRVEMEKKILRMLDHPFLPTLYAEFDASRYSCLVMEYCPEGDLLTVLQKQPRQRLSVASAKFYAAEVLLALEYLHAMGIIYRDLKPENVLIQEDGHIMLSDFDLSLKCEVSPKILQLNSKIQTMDKTMKCYCSCFSVSNKHNKKKKKNSSSCKATRQAHIPFQNDTQFWAEPVNACSSSFVGTHEYLAPEVILGLGHGSAVDWWTFGVFLYELLHGNTPFQGENNEKTLKNILEKPLRFPCRTSSSNLNQCDRREMEKAHDLIRKLLMKNPKKRMGSLWGALEIKNHEFFRGVNWALIRSVKPREIPEFKQKLINKDTTKVPDLHVDCF
ncbi:protein kinase PINOID 2-like [Pistacia vera]|uniref:protein kinase PINOID 2-like n=1 Tax=Pistacia vera TaxID=55513 RepID=UPI0012632449|nr:protein kinase PINOID 2-like [Pistacia vera]XP_031283106.1 protein kinase PINOID 2-like [Pistacia vera]